MPEAPKQSTSLPFPVGGIVDGYGAPATASY